MRFVLVTLKTSLVPRPVRGGGGGEGERAWYTLFAHARNILWNQDTLVISPCYKCNFPFHCTTYFCAMAELNDAVPALWKLVKAINVAQALN